MKPTVIGLASAFLIAVLIAPVAIKYLISIKFGQSIREIGPSWHKKKSGTPTMGGFIFIIPIVIVSCFLLRDARSIICVIAALGFGAVGFVDDYIKVVKKRNLGLTSKQKFLMQAAVTVFFIAADCFYIGNPTEILIPFGGSVNLSYFYYPFAAFVMLGCVNSVNLTDGIDGLASSVSIVVMSFFAIAAAVYGQSGMAVLMFTAVGAVFGFFLFNKNPARVFMGDTGSLFLGGMISAAALLLRQPIILVICGIVFFCETLSVILQVAHFKRTGKRLFKMSPIHHHFEMCGWKENKIDLVFVAVTAAACVVSYFGL